MINSVVLSARAQKDLERVPQRISFKLNSWILAVQLKGLEEIRKIPGYHDEPLQGVRFGQRSIRLNRSYRAIYKIWKNDIVEFVVIEEVNKHEY